MREADGDKRLKWAFALALLLHAGALAGAARIPAAVGSPGGSFEDIRVFDTAAPALVSTVDLVEWPLRASSDTSIEMALVEPVLVGPPAEESSERTPEAPRSVARSTAEPRDPVPQAETQQPKPVERARVPVVRPADTVPQPVERPPTPSTQDTRGDAVPAGGGGGGGGSVDLGSASRNGTVAGIESGGTPLGEVPGTGTGIGVGVGSGSGGGTGSGTGTGVGEGSGTGTGGGAGDGGTGGGFNSRVADRQEPEIISKGALEYPGSAVADGVEGMVRLKVLVSETGAVAEVDVIESSGDRRLDAAAAEFVGKWRYRPAVQDGMPRRVYTYAKVTFELD